MMCVRALQYTRVEYGEWPSFWMGAAVRLKEKKVDKASNTALGATRRRPPPTLEDARVSVLDGAAGTAKGPTRQRPPTQCQDLCAERTLAAGAKDPPPTPGRQDQCAGCWSVRHASGGSR
jgi:hypothetical protein